MKILYLTTLVCFSLFLATVYNLSHGNSQVDLAVIDDPPVVEHKEYQAHLYNEHVLKYNAYLEENKDTLCKQDNSCELLAKAVLYESRGEDEEGQKLVASVILNRVGDSKFPDTIEDVIYQKSQFSFIRDMHKQKKPTKESVVKARKIAYDILNKGVVNDKILWYHSTSVKPSWAKKAKGMKKGNHIFYGSL